MNNGLLTIRTERLRTGQLGAVDTILALVREGQRGIAIVLPPGYGKSDVIRVSGVMLMLQNLVSRALILEPSETLRSRVIDRQKMKEASDRYQLPSLISTGIPTWEVVQFPHGMFPPLRHKEARFVSMSTQMANHHRNRLVQWVKEETAHRGVPPVVFVDEAHTGSNMNEWGATTEALREAGAFTILLTGNTIPH